MADLTELIKHKAMELGFDLVGITDASPLAAEQVELLTAWLNSGCAGQMSYMHANFQKRINPAALLENARSVICTGLNYNPPSAAEAPVGSVPAGRVANYALYEDYHLFIKRQLHKLVTFIGSVGGIVFDSKICVDSAPLAERALAARAGLGFIGKSHMLINPVLGPQILLGEVITSLELETDSPLLTCCPGCSRCIAACPTGALSADGRFDANKCISYLTIEYKGRIPAELAEKIADRLFGCDECVLACPYWRDSPPCKNKQFKFYGNRAKVDLQQVLRMSQADFEKGFADSPVRRLGLERLQRNARICLANISSQLV
jgi:epoxyqueuosine reductase